MMITIRSLRIHSRFCPVLSLVIGMLAFVVPTLHARDINIVVQQGIQVNPDIKLPQSCQGYDAQGLTTTNDQGSTSHVLKLADDKQTLRVLMANLFLAISDPQSQGVILQKPENVTGSVGVVVTKLQDDGSFRKIFALTDLKQLFMMRALDRLAFILGMRATTCTEMVDGKPQACTIQETEHMGAVSCPDPTKCELRLACTLDGVPKPCPELLSMTLHNVAACSPDQGPPVPPVEPKECGTEDKMCCNMPVACEGNLRPICPTECDCSNCIHQCPEGDAICCPLPPPCPPGEQRVCKCATCEDCLGNCPDGYPPMCCNIPKPCPSGLPRQCKTDCPSCDQCPDITCGQYDTLSCVSQCPDAKPCQGGQARICCAPCLPDAPQCPASQQICSADCKQPPAIPRIPVRSVLNGTAYLLVTPEYIPANRCVKIEPKATAPAGNVTFSSQTVGTQTSRMITNQGMLTVHGPGKQGTSYEIVTYDGTSRIACSQTGACGNLRVTCLLNGQNIDCDKVARVNLFSCKADAGCAPCADNKKRICAVDCPTTCPPTGCPGNGALVCRTDCPGPDCLQVAYANPRSCKVCPEGSRAVCDVECCFMSKEEERAERRRMVRKCPVPQPEFFELMGTQIKIKHSTVPGKTVRIKLTEGPPDEERRLQLGLPIEEKKPHEKHPKGRFKRPTPKGGLDFKSDYEEDEGGSGFIEVRANNQLKKSYITDPHYQATRGLGETSIDCHREPDGTCATMFTCYHFFDNRWQRVCCNADFIDRICALDPGMAEEAAEAG